MKLYLLQPIHIPGDDPWEPWYDKAFGFVIRANSYETARSIANENAGDENRGEFLSTKISETKNPWLDERYSSCIELSPSGPEEMIIRDFASA
jgi:hypothetical protein